MSGEEAHLVAVPLWKEWRGMAAERSLGEYGASVRRLAGALNRYDWAIICGTNIYSKSARARHA